MNRCLAALGASCLLAASAAQAQYVARTAPAGVRPAELVVTAPPEIQLSGRPDRLSPGARIRDPRSMQVLSASLVGQTLPVVYRRDGAGLVHEVWILTPAEYARVAGGSDGTPEGDRRLAELLGAIFGARR